MTTKVTKTPVLDATTPDSGVGDGEVLGAADELRRRALEEELEKIEGEVQTLRQVLKNKVERSSEIRSQLADMGCGDRSVAEILWVKGGAIGESIGGGIDTFKKSAPVMRAGEVMNDISHAAAPYYQKTVEKTSSLFAKVKENTAVNSITERIGGVYSAARSKLPGAGGGDLEDAFKEGEKQQTPLAGEEQPQPLGEQQQQQPPVQQQQQQLA